MEYTQEMDWKEKLTGEMLLLSLLAKIIYTELDASWAQSLIDEEVFSTVPFGSDEAETKTGLEILNRWIQAQNGRIDDSCTLDLRTDYLKLFIGPGKMHAPVWESVYFSEAHLVFQERTLEVRSWYRRFGLETERLNREPDDHIGLELSFMARLATLALEALENDDKPGFSRLMTLQRKFFSEHLGQFGSTWAKLVIEHAGTDFYRGIGHLTLGSLQAVARILKVELRAKALE